MITMNEAVSAWRKANNSGAGYPAIGTGSIASAVHEYKDCGWKLLMARETDDDVAVMQHPSGIIVGIGGDAFGRNAWCCRV